MTLSDKFCKVDHSRLHIVDVEPEIRIRFGNTYTCGSCGKNYCQDETLTHQEKEAIEKKQVHDHLLGVDHGEGR